MTNVCGGVYGDRTVMQSWFGDRTGMQSGFGDRTVIQSGFGDRTVMKNMCMAILYDTTIGLIC